MRAAIGLRHPASASCLGRRSSSLHSAHIQRKEYFKFRVSGKSADFPETHFHGRGRNGKRHLQRRFLRKRSAAGERLLPLGGAVAQRLRGFESAEPEKTVKRSSRRTGVNLQFFPVELTSLGLKGASSPFFVAPARRNRWHFSGSLLVSKENIPRLRGFSQFSYFFASFIRLRFSSRMRSSTTFTALRMRALGIRTASVAHG